MNHYQAFLNIVANLRSGTIFSITHKWCATQGLSITPKDAVSIGKRFASEHGKYCVSHVDTTSANHRVYIKN